MLSPSEPSTYTVDSESEAAVWDPAITANVDVEFVSIARRPLLVDPLPGLPDDVDAFEAPEGLHQAGLGWLGARLPIFMSQAPLGRCEDDRVDRHQTAPGG